MAERSRRSRAYFPRGLDPRPAPPEDFFNGPPGIPPSREPNPRRLNFDPRVNSQPAPEERDQVPALPPYQGRDRSFLAPPQHSPRPEFEAPPSLPTWKKILLTGLAAVGEAGQRGTAQAIVHNVIDEPYRRAERNYAREVANRRDEMSLVDRARDRMDAAERHKESMGMQRANLDERRRGNQATEAFRTDQQEAWEENRENLRSDSRERDDQARADQEAKNEQERYDQVKLENGEIALWDKWENRVLDPDTREVIPDARFFQGREPTVVTDKGDIELYAQGVIDGDTPPPNLEGRVTQYSIALAAELERRGFDLATHRRDWVTTQKHLASLNSTQQLRLRQAVDFTYDSLDIIDGLREEWEQLADPSKFKVLNKVSLAAAKQTGGELGAVAQSLEAQINDLVSELATVYKGGNSSTDETLKLAAENLKADWDEATFSKQMEMIRKNLSIRRHSMISSDAMGVSEDSPYTPPQNDPNEKKNAPTGDRPPLGSFLGTRRE